MNRDWSNVRLETTLVSVIDSVVKELFVYGSRKYASRAEFTRTACLELLKKEGIQESKEFGKRSRQRERVAKEVPA